jgi:predicted PurR-regulated permease PerM
MTQLDNNRLRQTFFILLILSLGVLLFWKIYPFFTALLGAITFYVLFRKMMFSLTVKRKWNKALSAIIIMALSFIIILLPTAILLKVLYNKVMVLVVKPDEWIKEVEALVNQLNTTLGIDLLSTENLGKVPALLANNVSNILMATADTLLIVALLYFVLYFMLANGERMESWLFKNVPLKENNLKTIEKEIVSMVLSNAIGIPLLAVIQGVFAFIAYWILGVPDPLLWGTVTAFAAMLPVVGSVIVWIPLSLYLYFNGLEWQGVVLFLYGVLIIVNIDNVFRMVLQKRMANTHPLITMFGVIIGLSLFGFIGLIFGPLLVSLFIVLLRVYNDEFLKPPTEIETTKN